MTVSFGWFLTWLVETDSSSQPILTYPIKSFIVDSGFDSPYTPPLRMQTYLFIRYKAELEEDFVCFSRRFYIFVSTKMYRHSQSPDRCPKSIARYRINTLRGFTRM